VLLGLLGKGIQLSQDLLPMLEESGTQSVSPPMMEQYLNLVQELHSQKSNESVLSDESWEWIWDTKRDLSNLQLYGRLAWLNYTLFDLL
jgi:hypothetical protein